MMFRKKNEIELSESNFEDEPKPKKFRTLIVKIGRRNAVIACAVLLIGAAVAFAVSLIAIKFLMNFVKKHDFKLFGWYRIALGAVVIGALIIPQLLA